MLWGLALPQTGGQAPTSGNSLALAQNAPAPTTSSAPTIIRLFRVVIEPSTARAPLPRVAAKKPLAPPRSLAGRFPRRASSARPITGCVIIHRLRNHDRLCCVIAGLRRRRREGRGRCEELWCVNQWPVPMRSRVEGYGRGWTCIIVERSRNSVVAIWRLLGRCDAR